MTHLEFRETIYKNILDLATPDGINASSKEEIYGCIFGRDSAITILKILKVLSCNQLPKGADREKLLLICKTALLTLVNLQGKESNIESGEQPGKFIHEYRKEKFDHLLGLSNPWYVYPDGILRNYDSIDSTPLVLIALYKYFEVTNDGAFLMQILPSVEKGLNWIISYGDLDKDYLVEYEFSRKRKYGGLLVQSWTDSHQSLRKIDGTMPEYPIAPVEAQGYSWLALRLWGEYFSNSKVNYLGKDTFSRQLLVFSEKMKEKFNMLFLLKSNGLTYGAQALDGSKNQIQTITGNPLLLLWSSYIKDGEVECIIDNSFIPDFVKRAFNEDLFDPIAGIRTMSTTSLTYDSTSNSYHNGSFWPKLNGMVHEGLSNWSYVHEAKLLWEASIKPLLYFKSPVELYLKNELGGYVAWKNIETGQEGCKIQAWSAAAAFDLLTIEI